MLKTTLDLDLVIGPQALAQGITDKYLAWRNARAQKEKASQEVRNYVFATDTTTTTNNKLPWKNKTTRPKLCQIRDNLFANYIKGLFSNDDWLLWQAEDEEGANADKKLAIEAYMRHILRNSRFQATVAEVLLDWIDYGNCFGDVIAVNETKKTSAEQELSIYTGPKLVRVSPLDIVFDITAPSFVEAPKITRTLVSYGQLKKLKAMSPDWAKVSDEIIKKLGDNRATVVSGNGNYDALKAQRLTADGFATLADYYASGKIEVLDFEGDYYDVQANTLYENHRITVVDRAYVVRNEPITGWVGVSHKQHCGWRLRPDNAWAMGPLDNLVGLQYRLDHLENMKADIFDMIAHPVMKVKGYVEDFEYGPNEKIYMEQDADVEFMHPEAIALNADMQIQIIENAMEELAGAPKQAMGIRTPGEKTKFEVQTLDNAASRLFQSKLEFFEKFFLEPIVNSMLEIARSNLDNPVLINVTKDDLGVDEFLSISREDITGKGRLVATGARHFAAQAALVQNLVQLSNTGIYQDPAVVAHLSAKAIARLVVEALNLEKYNVYSENVRVMESMETEQLAMQASEELQVSALTPVEQGAQPPTMPPAQE